MNAPRRTLELFSRGSSLSLLTRTVCIRKRIYAHTTHACMFDATLRAGRTCTIRPSANWQKMFQERNVRCSFCRSSEFRAITKHHDSNPIDLVDGICPRLSDSTGVCRKSTGPAGIEGRRAERIDRGGVHRPREARARVRVLLLSWLHRNARGSSFRIRISQDCCFWAYP